MSGPLDWLYPNGLVCPFCGEEKALGPENLCEACADALIPCSGTPRPCAEPLDGLSAGLLYAGPVRDAVHRFKYGGQRWLAHYLAAYMALPEGWAVDGVVPVPLHPLKRWLRAYNQSELLAGALLERSSFAPLLPGALRRVRYTRSQTKLFAEEREKNLAGAFRAGGGLTGKSLLLIDDVATTRGTLYACASALKAAGASRVYALCAADADHSHGTGGETK